MRIVIVAALVLAFGPLVAGAAHAQPHKKRAPQPYSHQVEREKINENVLMLLGGTAGGPYMQLAQDIATGVKDAEKVRVIPLASDGAMGNVRDVLLLRGVDLGITSLQALNAIKASAKYGPNLERRIAYIAPLTVGPLHVLVRNEVKSVKDLNGKKVNVLQKGSGTSNYGIQIFKALGVEIIPVNHTHNDAVQLMRSGEIDAALCVCPIPVPAMSAIKPEFGFKYLEVPYTPELEETFLPASLNHEHYPNLVPPGTKVQTVGTSTVLIAYNWQPGSERYRKIEKFVDAFFSNIEKLRKPPHPPAWKDTNIAASVRGWHRFPAAQQWLDRQAAQAAAKARAEARAEARAKAKAEATVATPPRTQAPKGGAGAHDAAAQEKLFQEFLEWSKKQPKR
jgi:TRAP transporter TAXI family solute receptor